MHTKQTLFSAFMGLALTGSACSAVVGMSQNFSSPTSTSGWTSVGTLATSISRTTSNRDGTGGDGVTSDGALMFNTLDNTAGNEAIGFSFSGTIEQGESYTLTISTFNPTSSYNGYNIQLYNFTHGTILAQTGSIGQVGGTTGTLERTLVYDAQVADVGDTLGIRIVENHDNAARDMALDQFTLTVVPEPSCVGLAGIGLSLIALRRRRA